MARRGKFDASLQPFGAGTLNLDAAYAVETLTATPSPPDAGAPPPLQYGGTSDGAVSDPTIPTVGTTPVPPGVLAAPTALQPWKPAPTMTLSQFNAANRAGVIGRAQTAGVVYNTATVNNTVANDYAKYLASLAH